MTETSAHGPSGPARRPPSTLLLLASAMLWTVNTPAQEDKPFGDRIVAQARIEARDHGASYAVDAEVRIPWREGGFAKDEWKCNFFAMNVLYEAGGQVPTVAYGPGFKRLVSNYRYWRGRDLSPTGRYKVKGSHYPLARDLANPALFVATLPVVNGKLTALRPGDVVFMKPPEDSPHGHCLVYLGERDGTSIKAAYATEDGITIDFYDIDQPRGYTMRRPRPAPTP